MAYSKKAMAEHHQVLTIDDYSVTPNSTAVDLISISAMTSDSVESTEIFKTSSTGRVRHGNPVTGVKGGQQMTIVFWAHDLDNVTDANPWSLILALANNSVAGTFASGYDFTSPLAAGGKLTAKFKRIEYDQAGVASTTTYPAEVLEVAEGYQDGVKTCTATLRVLVAPTRA